MITKKEYLKAKKEYLKAKAILTQFDKEQPVVQEY